MGFTQRQGLGKLRHIDRSSLFVQRLTADKVFQLAEVSRKDNLAVVRAKGLAWDAVEQHVTTEAADFASGRPALCPKACKPGER